MPVEPPVVSARSLREAFELLAGQPHRVLAGGTDLLVQLTGELGPVPDRVLDLWQLDELRGIAVRGDTLELGALTTYAAIRRSPACGEHAGSLVDAAATIGATQIQHRGTIGGNVMNASPAGDTLPVLLALDAVLVLGSVAGEREVAAADFWPAYRRTAARPDELLVRVRIPIVAGREQRFRKVGTRRAQAISKVVVATAWHGDDAWRDVRIALGSVAPTPIRVAAAEAALEGRPRTPASVESAVGALGAAISPIDDVRSTAAYRREAARRVVRRLLMDALEPGGEAPGDGRMEDGCGMTELGSNRYGKRSIRLVRVVRGDPVHRVRDLTVDVSLEGAFEAAFVVGDNASVVATDTMKNTVYAFATEHLTGAIEAFGIRLATHFHEADAVDRATISIREHPWEPLETSDGPAPDAFRRSGAMTRTAVVSAGHGGVTVDSGIEDLVVMKTARSAFSGFPRDRYTTLPEVRERIMATRVTASWRNAGEAVDWDRRHASLVRTLLASFADHDSESVQHSIWLIGTAMLAAEPGISEVTMRLPNLHHWLVDLTPFGGTNGEIFVATAEPYGQIEATVRRADGA